MTKVVCSAAIIGFSAVAFLSALTGCSTEPVTVALGSVSEVMVVADPSLAAARDQARQVLGEEIYFAFRTEPYFTTEGIDLGRPSETDWQGRKNVLLLGTGTPGEEYDRLIGPYLSPEEYDRLGKTEALFLRIIDPWAKYQTVSIVWTDTPATLKRVLDTRGEELRQFVEDGARAVLSRTLVAGGANETLRGETLSRFGWGLNLPPTYRADMKHADENFVSFRRDDPPLLIFVHWQEGSSLPPPDSCLALRDELGKRFYRGDKVVTDRSTATTTVFLGRESVRLEGLWRNDELVIGGPFAGYWFVAPEQNRIYYLDLAVYAPPMDKLNLMRELEALALTFSLGEPAQEPPPGA